ncbi:MAG: DegT/DnrJ/EryC1/StrS family aminotransferase, partial [Pseudomonadota bacterium]
VETLNDAIQSAGAALKAVCVVHLGGQPVDLAAISAICKQRNLLLIEDACHAIGSTYQESTIGDCTYSDVATFSFHPVKTIAMGEGGAVLTRHGDIAEKVRTLRHHSLVASDDVPGQRLMHDLGYNYRACDIQCALGKSQLQKLDRFKQIRSALVEQYRLTLAALDSPASLNPLKVTTEPCYHLAQARIDFAALGTTREEVVAALASVGIGTQVHYYPVSAQPYYIDLYGAADTPGAWSYYDKTLSLPLHVNMTLAEVNFICRQLHGILTGQDMRQCA